jgi:hypothetical protein
MPSINLNSIKQILQISDASLDTEISQMIPFIIQDIISETNNHFIRDFFLVSDGISFTYNESEADFLEIDDSDVTDEMFNEFIVDQNILIYGSKSNDSSHIISAVHSETRKITIDENESFETEGADNSIILRIHDFPLDVIRLAAKIFNYHNNHLNDDGIKSEKILSYSVTYAENKKAYPDSILSGLLKYKQLNNPYPDVIYKGREIQTVIR